MGEFRCTLKQAQDGVEIPLDESTTLIVVPAVAQVTLKGRAFEAGRTFLLPRAVNALNEVFAFATRMQAKHAVVVGHVEPIDPKPDELSGTRAKIAQSWLAGDTAPWLEQFGAGIPEEQRWGAREDRQLLTIALGDSPTPAVSDGETGDPRVRAFQKLAGVKVDGIAGPVTRGKLVEKFFALSRSALLDGAAAPENGITRLETKVVAHPGGARFSQQQVRLAKRTADEAESTADEAESTAATPEAKPESQSQSESEARVDFMFFFADAGPDPAPGAPDGLEFLEWVKQTELQRVATVSAAAGAQMLFLELWDKAMTGQHKGAKYKIAGPESYSGTTDSQGRVQHDDVLAGDYVLTLTLDFFDDDEKVTEEYQSSVVVQRGVEQPQVRALAEVPIVPLLLRFCVQTFARQALASVACSLTTNLGTITGQTDADGKVPFRLGSTAQQCTLDLDVSPTPFAPSIPVELGGLESITSASGQRARLRNLGYLTQEDGESASSPLSRATIEEFQVDHGLTVDGVCGAKTQAELRKQHGS